MRLATSQVQEMDILIVKLSLLILGPLIIAACVIYSVSMIREVGALAYFRQVIKLGKVCIAGIGTLLASLIGLLVPTGKPETNTRPQLNGSDLIGEHNFRTGRPDSGADSDGWYEEDM